MTLYKEQDLIFALAVNFTLIQHGNEKELQNFYTETLHNCKCRQRED